MALPKPKDTTLEPSSLKELLEREHRLLILSVEQLREERSQSVRKRRLNRFRRAFNKHVGLEQVCIGVPAKFTHGSVQRSIRQDWRDVTAALERLDQLNEGAFDSHSWECTVDHLQDILTSHLFRLEEEVLEEVIDEMNTADTHAMSEKLREICGEVV